MQISLRFIHSCNLLLTSTDGKGESIIEMELRWGIGIRVLEERLFKDSLAGLKSDQHEMENLMLLASSKRRDKGASRVSSQPRKMSLKEIHL